MGRSLVTSVSTCLMYYKGAHFYHLPESHSVGKKSNILWKIELASVSNKFKFVFFCGDTKENVVCEMIDHKEIRDQYWAIWSRQWKCTWAFPLLLMETLTKLFYKRMVLTGHCNFCYCWTGLRGMIKHKDVQYNCWTKGCLNK